MPIEMNCFCSIYILIIALFCLILLAIFHANMILTTYQEDEHFRSSLSPVPVSFKINSVFAFERLISFFNLFKKPLTPDEESEKMRKFFQAKFPNIHKCSFIKITTLKANLLLEVHAVNSSQKPFLIGADLDAEILDSWTVRGHFQVDNINKAITGLGAMSSKSLVMSLMEALDLFIRRGHVPTRSFYILFLKDGDFFDHCSSESVLEYFKKQNVHFEFVLESPGVVLNHILPGINSAVAIIGTSRKPYMAIELNINQLQQVRKSTLNLSPFPLTSTITSISSNSENNFGQGSEISMITNLSKYASYPHRLAYTNLWFFKPLLSHFMSSHPYWQRVIRTKSILRTYHYMGMTEAVAIVEQEMHTKAAVYEQKELLQKIANKYKTNMRICDIYQPTRAFYSSRTSAFLAIKDSIQLTFPHSIVIPGDCYIHSHLRHFENITKYIYQFSPTIFSIDGVERYYTNAERLTLTEYVNTVRFYYNLLVVTNH